MTYYDCLASDETMSLWLLSFTRWLKSYVHQLNTNNILITTNEAFIAVIYCMSVCCPDVLISGARIQRFYV